MFNDNCENVQGSKTFHMKTQHTLFFHKDILMLQLQDNVKPAIHKSGDSVSVVSVMAAALFFHAVMTKSCKYTGFALTL